MLQGCGLCHPWHRRGGVGGAGVIRLRGLHHPDAGPPFLPATFKRTVWHTALCNATPSNPLLPNLASTSLDRAASTHARSTTAYASPLTPSSRLTPDRGRPPQHPDDKNAAWLPKLIVLLGLFLTCAMVLMLPFDASMSQSCESDPECGVVGMIAQVWCVPPPDLH